MTDPNSFALLDQTVRDTARRYLADFGASVGAEKAGVTRPTLVSLAAGLRVTRGTIFTVADALGLVSVATPSALAVSSLPTASDLSA